MPITFNTNAFTRYFLTEEAYGTYGNVNFPDSGSSNVTTNNGLIFLNTATTTNQGSYINFVGISDVSVRITVAASSPVSQPENGVYLIILNSLGNLVFCAQNSYPNFEYLSSPGESFRLLLVRTNFASDMVLQFTSYEMRPNLEPGQISNRQGYLWARDGSGASVEPYRLRSTRNSTSVQVFTSNGTWTKPANARIVRLFLVGGGGGGGSGRLNTSLGTVSYGGAGGGPGGVIYYATFPASLFAASEPVIVGSGGTGGAGRSTTGDGNPGTAGGTSSFSTGATQIFATGGDGGFGGSTVARSVANPGYSDSNFDSSQVQINYSGATVTFGNVTSATPGYNNWPNAQGGGGGVGADSSGNSLSGYLTTSGSGAMRFYASVLRSTGSRNTVPQPPLTQNGIDSAWAVGSGGFDRFYGGLGSYGNYSSSTPFPVAAGGKYGGGGGGGAGATLAATPGSPLYGGGNGAPGVVVVMSW